MPNINPGPATTATANSQDAQLAVGTTASLSYANLPPASSVSAGYIAYTSDQGLVVSNGSSWVPSGGAGFTLSPSGDVSGATDFARLNALAATAGIIQLKAGTYYLNAALTFTASVVILGAGSADGGAPSGTANSVGLNANTVLLFGTASSSTINGITLQGPGSVIQDVHVQSASTVLATAGIGILLNGANGGCVFRCSTYGFRTGIKAKDTYSYSFLSNKVFGPSVYGITQNNQAHPDQSDCRWDGNWSVANALNGATPTAAYAIFNGGGPKLSGNKANGNPQSIPNANRWTNCLLIQPGGDDAAGSTSSTSVFNFHANSFESSYVDNVLFDGTAVTAVSITTITAITFGLTTTITVTSTAGLLQGQLVSFASIVTAGNTSTLNGQQGKILSIVGNVISLAINSNAGYGTYSSGGTVNQVNTWKGFAIIGNEFSSVSGGCVNIKGGPNCNFLDLNIDGNYSPGTQGFYVNAYSGCSNVNVGSFSADSMFSPFVIIGQGTGLNASYADVQNVTYDLSKFSCNNFNQGTGQGLVLDYTCNAEDSHVQGTQLTSFSREIPSCGGAIATTAASGTGSVATLTFATTTMVIPVGSYVKISGVTPAGYNAVAQVTASTTTTISYANTTTGAQTVAGTITLVLAAIQLQPFDMARVKVVMTAQFPGYGAEVASVERALIANGSATIAATVIGAITAGTPANTDYYYSLTTAGGGSQKTTIGFDVSVNNWCYITLAQTALGQWLRPIGSITFETEGAFQQIIRY